ncbi:MAG: soluble lytic murein transglycosylase [Candidatus Tokpelaia sp. JSC161]|jgi:soluble lytic murein transglycosylase|nr:MAG: soluble lytic murein transglycosylase [Candidatus Tokpelaia sp. JSC161]
MPPHIFFLVSIILIGNILLHSLSLSFAQTYPIPHSKPQQPLSNKKIVLLNSSNKDIEKLRIGLQSLQEKKIEQAIGLRDDMPYNSPSRNTLTWAIAVSNIKEIPSTQFRQAIIELKNWPGHSIIEYNLEKAFIYEQHSSKEIINFFSKKKPQTTSGMIAFTQALITKDRKKAHALIASWWPTAKLTNHEEKMVIQEIGTILTKIDYQRRFKNLIDNSQINSAQNIAQLAGETSLYKGLLAVISKKIDAAKQLEAINKSLKQNTIYRFARIKYLRNNKQYIEAARVALNRQNNEISTHTDLWWNQIRILSRELLDIGNIQLAYQLAATQKSQNPTIRADAEFHAGWYALRFLNKPKTALKHFSHLNRLSSHPISIARSLYWMGRTTEIMHDKKTSKHFFQKASRYKTTFYGQLAATHLKKRTLKIDYPHPTEKDRKEFKQLATIKVIQNLESAGFRKEAIILYKELSYHLKSPGKLSLLSGMAEKYNDYYTSLKIGQNAVYRGIPVEALSYPLGVIPSDLHISNISKAMTYAIGRQESEFNPLAKSSANARGILQILPQTAKEIALEQGKTYSLKKLVDPGYNISLGIVYLNKELEKFDRSYLLTFIGYNAGPRRAEEWIKRYGDPRGASLEEVVDWIERIPYHETRNYVQRVMENYEVYKARLKGETDIKTDLILGYPKK